MNDMSSSVFTGKVFRNKERKDEPKALHQIYNKVGLTINIARLNEYNQCNIILKLLKLLTILFKYELTFLIRHL